MQKSLETSSAMREAVPESFKRWCAVVPPLGYLSIPLVSRPHGSTQHHKIRLTRSAEGVGYAFQDQLVQGAHCGKRFRHPLRGLAEISAVQFARQLSKPECPILAKMYS